MFLSHAFLKVLGPGLFGAWLCVVGVSASLADEVNRPATELEVLKKKIERLQKQMASRRKEESSALSDLDSSEREIAKLDQTHERLVAQAKSESVKLESLSNEWLSLTQNDVRSKDAFQALLRSGYILNRQGGMRLFFDGKDPAEVGRSLTFYRYLIEARQDQIKALADRQRQIQELSASLERQKSRTREGLEALDQSRALLVKKKAERKHQLAKIQRSLSQDVQVQKRYIERETELQALLKQINPSTSETGNSTDDGGQVDGREEGGGFAGRQGLLPMPLEAPIRHLFGSKKAESGVVWKGLMIAADEGQEVSAIHDGQVVYADWFGGYGQLVVLDHGDGYMSLYGHNQRLYVELGDRVTRQERIASAGQTGGLIQPGLYFEIRQRGEAVDPLEWCLL